MNPVLAALDWRDWVTITAVVTLLQVGGVIALRLFFALVSVMWGPE